VCVSVFFFVARGVHGREGRGVHGREGRGVHGREGRHPGGPFVGVVRVVGVVVPDIAFVFIRAAVVALIAVIVA
jgi:hypothetical protein